MYEDLGIYGDDVEDFFSAFSREFKVDVSKFMAADYFKGEGIDFITPIINIMSEKNTRSKKLKPLMLGHLEKAILAGRLDEEVINSY